MLRYGKDRIGAISLDNFALLVEYLLKNRVYLDAQGILTKHISTLDLIEISNVPNSK